MEPVHITVAVAAAIASLLTFYSGFGLGTILLPAFAFFFPLDLSVALTALVHFSNNVFKFFLMRKEIKWSVALGFGLPAVLMAFLGAHLLAQLGDWGSEVQSYSVLGMEREVSYLGLLMGGLLIFFAFFELLVPKKEEGKSSLVLGGALSGFFGGLSGHQGALRSLFLLRQGLSKESFIATGIAIACAVDVGRILVYSVEMETRIRQADSTIVLVAVLAAFAGAVLGKKFLKKATIKGIQIAVTTLLVLIGLAMMAGLLGTSH